MKVGILAGGLGSRLAEETEVKPKPMVEIGGRPILWHIMNLYMHFGFSDFVLALGYKGEVIKRYMVDYYYSNNNLLVDLHDGLIKIKDRNPMRCAVELVDTGGYTMTGGRVKRLKPFMGDGTCMVTYGDGVSNVNLKALLEFHRSHGKLATITAVHPPARYGKLEIEDNKVLRFVEKPQLTGDKGAIAGEGWINGGFFVFEPGVFDYIEGDDTPLEREPLERLAEDGQLMAYRHFDFWQCMDTIRDKQFLQRLWDDGNPPWKIWS
ncbi:MAG: glucose-1-phosphate cytidylyltransferase [Burkholderiales bacterium]